MAYDPFISHSRDGSVGNIDPRNPHFVGRESELTQLQNILAQESFCILSGAHEGVGTTALAVEYAHRFAGEYDGGCWQVRFEGGQASLANTLAALLSHRARVGETHRCLLVLDEVAQTELLKSARQFAKGVHWLHVIVTTGLKEEVVLGDDLSESVLRVEGLPKTDVLALIESFQPNRTFANADDQRTAEQLASLLDGLTLPAEVAAASVNYFDGSPTLADLVANLSEAQTELHELKFDGRTEWPKPVRQESCLREIIQIILTHLSGPARSALNLAASSGEQFELSEIREFCAREFGEIRGDTVPDHGRWQILFDHFFKLRLWQPTNEVDAKGELLTARMHPLLQLSIQQILTVGNEARGDRVLNQSVSGEVEASNTTGKVSSQALHPLDDNVMFTVYRRKTVAPNKWYPLLAFAHLSERRPDAPPDEPDPVVEVKRQAEAILGPEIAEYKQSSEDSSQPIPRSGELMFKPFVPGIEFNPPSRNLRWEEPVHREEFKMRATHELEGQFTRGWLRVFLGPIIVAEVNLTFKVDSNAVAGAVAPDSVDHARPFRKVFASYSHKDKAVVEEIERLVRGTSLGLEYLRDVTKLRSGDEWNESLLQMIDTADTFQLFWSSNSMDSPYVKLEYERALARQVKDFVRPVYWEKPFPARPEQNLPPEALKRLHFEELSIVAAAQVPDQRQALKEATYCKKCGCEFDVDAKFCLNCGSIRMPADIRVVGIDPPRVNPGYSPAQSSEVKSGGPSQSAGCGGSPLTVGVFAILGFAVGGLLLFLLILVIKYFSRL